MTISTTDTIDTPTTNDRIAARLADLTASRAAIPSLGSRPLSMTHAESDALDAEGKLLDRRLAVIDSAVRAVEAAEALVSAADDSRWRDRLTTYRARCSDAWRACPANPRTAVARGRDQNYRLSIQTIDRGPQVLDGSGYDLATTYLGDLMREDGYEPVGADPSRNFAGVMPWFGSLPEVEKRIVTLDKQRAQAHAALEAALLSDDERATQDAEAKAGRDALNALIIKVSSDGKKLVAYKNKQNFYDDVPYVVDDMTPVEREAFARMDAAHRQV